jgi:methyl-accepting chemotaxis protein
MLKRFSLTQKLITLFFLFGLVPLGVIWIFSNRASNEMEVRAAQQFQQVAETISDKIDRNLFERYGDVQAFGYNQIVQDRSQWYKVGEDQNAIVRSMNRYVDCYDLYSLTIMADLEGRVIAVNSRDRDGKPIVSEQLYEKNYAQAPWFTACKSGQFTTKMPFTAPGNDVSNGTYIEDLHVDSDVQSAYQGDDGYALGFSAPVVDENGNMVAIWSNRFNFSYVEAFFASAFQELKSNGFTTAEFSLINGDGKVITDYAPHHQNSEALQRPKDVILKRNLAREGIAAAGEAVSGKTGFMYAKDPLDQQTVHAAGFAHLKGALGYPGMNWSVLVMAHRDEAAAAAIATQRSILIVAVLCLLATLTLGWYIGRWFSRPIEKIAAELAGSAEQVAQASEQISQSSQSLAEGASEQAATVEETSANLVQLLQLTRSNSQRAGEANELMNSASQAVSKVSGSVDDMQNAMREIRQSSDQTSRIVKTIDEIAFQTNLLALNAAVEAARAGESGKGFAVVAEEVRNLALRAGDAARNTGTLIEDTVNRVKIGEAASVGLVSSLQEVREITAKTQELNQLIAEAAADQTLQIEQVTSASSQISEVTQRNAATAEESSSASVELNTQAQSSQNFVASLFQLIRGSRNCRE